MKTMKICEILRREDIGDMGIGAMIVFIAMVLVAGIAASVLVQTANRLEIRAMITGEQTTAEVATGIEVFDIEGHATASEIDYLTVSISPRAGSRDIDLKETVMELSDGTTKVLLSYNETNTWNFNDSVSAFNGQIFSVYTLGWNMSNDEFGILVLEDADGSCTVETPVINRGDSVMLCINTESCFGGLDTRDDIWGMVMPEEGVSGVFSFRVPASLSDTVYDLY
jgi:archaeal flagellin FlaB